MVRTPGIIVGSSNASTNGLRFEGKQAEGNIEANLFTDDASVVSKAISWFDAEWSDARKVDKVVAEEARPFWDHTQANRNPIIRGTLLKAMKEHPKDFADADLWVVLYPDGPPSKQARKAFEAEAPLLYSSRQLRDLDGSYPFYEDDEGNFPFVPGKTTILDFCYDDKNRKHSFVFADIWRVREENYNVPMKVTRHPNARIVMCDLLHEYDGLRVPKQEARTISKMLLAYVVNNNLWNGAEREENYGFTVRMKLSDLLAASAVKS